MAPLLPTAATRKTPRALLGLGALCVVLAVQASACGGSPAPLPTADPFAGLADRSDAAFRQGLEAYGQGQYRDALNAFQTAHTLSPTADPRIDQMIARTTAAMAPTPTPVPPTPTPVPPVPTTAPLAMSTQTADTELGQRYFGQVTLAIVPGRESDAPAATQFFFQDQIGLHIEGLQQHLRLPFTLRVFNTDTKQLVADVRSEDAATVVPTLTPVRTDLAPPAPTAAAIVGTPGTGGVHLVRFWDTYVWYHQGGEDPGNYVAELYANGILTHALDYSVGTVPVPSAAAAPAQSATDPGLTPSSVQDGAPVLPEPSPALALPLALPAAASVRTPPGGQPAAAAAEVAQAPTPPAEPSPIPTPTPVPTPAQAYTTAVGGVPSGLDVNASSGRFYLADSSGVIWTTDSASGQQRPTLGTPFNIGSRLPVDLAADPSTGNLYLSTRACAPAAPGCVLAVDGATGVVLTSISLQAAPGDLRLDPAFGLLYVALPERQAIAEVNIRAGNVVRMIEQLPQITSLALDPLRHTLYATHLGGQLTVIDTPSGQVTARLSLTAAGLAGVATARGLAYAVNTATHELAVVEPVSGSVSRYVLTQEPAAIAAAEDSGAVYVLSSRADLMLQIDPSDGSELGRVLLAARSGHASVNSSNIQSLRPRMVLDAANDTLFVSLPEAGVLAAVSNAQFPPLARSIPYIVADAPDTAVASSIPGVIRPADGAPPAQPVPPVQAQAPNAPPPVDAPTPPPPPPSAGGADEDGL